MSIESILVGWKNFIDKSEVTEKLARERATHCVGCKHKKHGTVLGMIKDKLTEIQSAYCEKCSCVLSAKLRVEKESCPLKKW